MSVLEDRPSSTMQHQPISATPLQSKSPASQRPPQPESRLDMSHSVYQSDYRYSQKPLVTTLPGSSFGLDGDAPRRHHQPYFSARVMPPPPATAATSSTTHPRPAPMMPQHRMSSKELFRSIRSSLAELNHKVREPITRADMRANSTSFLPTASTSVATATSTFSSSSAPYASRFRTSASFVDSSQRSSISTSHRYSTPTMYSDYRYKPTTSSESYRSRQTHISSKTDASVTFPHRMASSRVSPSESHSAAYSSVTYTPTQPPVTVSSKSSPQHMPFPSSTYSPGPDGDPPRQSYVGSSARNRFSTSSIPTTRPTDDRLISDSITTRYISPRLSDPGRHMATKNHSADKMPHQLYRTMSQHAPITVQDNKIPLPSAIRENRKMIEALLAKSRQILQSRSMPVPPHPPQHAKNTTSTTAENKVENSTNTTQVITHQRNTTNKNNNQQRHHTSSRRKNTSGTDTISWGEISKSSSVSGTVPPAAAPEPALDWNAAKDPSKTTSITTTIDSSHKQYILTLKPRRMDMPRPPSYPSFTSTPYPVEWTSRISVPKPGNPALLQSVTSDISRVVTKGVDSGLSADECKMLQSKIEVQA